MPRWITHPRISRDGTCHRRRTRHIRRELQRYVCGAIYRVRVENGNRQLTKTLEMHDPAGGFGITRVVTTPDGEYFAYNTLRQLSELYLLQGLN